MSFRQKKSPLQTLSQSSSPNKVYCLRDERPIRVSHALCEVITVGTALLPKMAGVISARAGHRGHPPAKKKRSVSANPQPRSAPQKRCLHLQCARRHRLCSLQHQPSITLPPREVQAAPTPAIAPTTFVENVFTRKVSNLQKKSDESHTTKHYVIRNQKYHRHTAAVPLYSVSRSAVWS